MICDAHVHFFSPAFFRQLGASAEAITGLGWDDPISPESLADRWVTELDRHAVARASLIASSPADAASVAIALARHPTRFVGFFMVDPTQDGALSYLSNAFEKGLRTVCLFPAMHHYALQDPRVSSLFEVVASWPAAHARQSRPAVFVHCGELSIGVRKKLGLPSPFDLTRGNPLHLVDLANRHSQVPMIIPHFGAGRLDEALTLAAEAGNVYLDTSSSNSWMERMPAPLSLTRVFDRALSTLGPTRLLFGTDSSFFPRGWHRAVFDAQSRALDELAVDAESRNLIFGGNFARLFPEAGR
jgi:predicted TIM-barrel fold metal-dependent hydrolase